MAHLGLEACKTTSHTDQILHRTTFGHAARCNTGDARHGPLRPRHAGKLCMSWLASGSSWLSCCLVSSYQGTCIFKLHLHKQYKIWYTMLAAGSVSVRLGFPITFALILQIHLHAVSGHLTCLYWWALTIPGIIPLQTCPHKPLKTCSFQHP